MTSVVFRATVGAVALMLGLAACSTQPVDYQHIQLLPPLQVPEGLQAPRTNSQMAIPGLPLENVDAVRRRLASGSGGEDIEKPPAMPPAEQD